MKRILTQSAWVIIAVSLALGSTLNLTAADKDKQREAGKGQAKEMEEKGRHDPRDKDEKNRDRHDKDRNHKDKDHDEDRHKVTICHRGHTISVSKSALQAHLNHGDTIGPCEVTPHRNR
jgi:Ni/Co efflux regulator RcnB